MTRLSAFTCGVRRLLRRYSWWYLAAAFILAYPVQWMLLIAWQVRGVHGRDELASAIAEASGKTVDPLLFYCKLAIGLALFASINLLGFAALAVVPVLKDWAYGVYSRPGRYQAVGLEAPVPGFKRTFLQQSGTVRLAVYLVAWALELAVAGWSMEAAFRIQ